MARLRRYDMRRLLLLGVVALVSVAALVPVANAGATTHRYPNTVRNAFVKGCVQGGGSHTQCKCVIRKIERRYTLKQFERIVRRVSRGGEFPTPVTRFVESCA